MAEESFQEKTEQATPKRREEARQKGQVARSNELSSVAILLTGFMSLSFLGAYMYDHLRNFTMHILLNSFTLELNTITIRSHVISWLASFGKILAPMVILLVAAALAVNYAQIGVLFAGKQLEPKFNRISPMSGIKRIFSLRGLVELAKGLFKIGAVAYITYLTIDAETNRIVSLIDMEVGQIFGLSGSIILSLGFRISLLLLVMAILDYSFQRYDYEKNLRMTRQEVREEVKQQEGDPQIRSRIRTLQREMSQQRMMSDVGQADVVVTNPTHIAVALRYNSEEMEAPVLLAKGQRLVAEKIKELARQAGVPLVENKPLARALFKAVQIGEEVPEELFKAVAEVLAFVFQLRQKSS